VDNFGRDLIRLLWGTVLVCLLWGCLIGGTLVWVWLT